MRCHLFPILACLATFLLTCPTRAQAAVANNPGIAIDGEIIVTSVVCPGTNMTATAKLKWPPTITNRPSGTFTWKLVPTDLATLTAPPGGTSIGNDSSDAAMTVTTTRSTAARSFQVQVSWQGPPNYSMPSATATVSIKRDIEIAFGTGRVIDWNKDFDLVELVPIKGELADFVKAMLAGSVTSTVSFTSGYHSAVRLECPGKETASGPEFAALVNLEHESAQKVIRNNLPKIVEALLVTAAGATTNGQNPLTNPQGALDGLKNVASQLGASAIKAITEQSTAGVEVPMKNPPGRGDIKTEYDDVLALAKKTYSADNATLPIWALDDPKISVTFNGAEPQWTQNFVNYLKDKLIGGLPEPVREIIEDFIKPYLPQ